MIIEKTYFHKMTVYRSQEVVDEFGGTTNAFSVLEGLEGVSCGYSQYSRNATNTTQTESVDNININPKIYCNPNFDIITGDRIEIKFRNKNLGTFVASRPYLYDTHQEIPLHQYGEA